MAQEIIIAEIEDQPPLTLKQQEELLTRAELYLRTIRQPLSGRVVLRQAVEVIGDSVRRGLLQEGKMALTPKDRLQPLAKIGLEERAELLKRFRAILNLTPGNEGTYKELSGPLALPLSLLVAASREHYNFFLTSSLAHVEEVTKLGEQRIKELDRLTQIGLNSLPPPLNEKVTLSEFSFSKRAQIARNMIASFVFRGNPIPLITIADLKSFVETSGDVFNDESKKDLIELFSGEQMEDFLNDLFVQTKTPFNIYTTLPDENDPQNIDKFYRQFSRDLLLLEPALEEPRIITTAERIKPDRPSLWDNGIIIGDSKIPTPEMLSQAARQAEAVKDYPLLHRLNDGIAAWSWYEEKNQRHRTKIQIEEQQIERLEDLLLNLSNPDFPLPNQAFTQRSKLQEEVLKDVIGKAREMEYFLKIAVEAKESEDQAKKYQQHLNTKYQNNLPELLPMPSNLLKNRLEKQATNLKRKMASYKTSLSLMEEILEVDLLRIYQFGTATGMLHKDNALEEINRQLLDNKTTNIPLTKELVKTVINYLTDGVGQRVREYRYVGKPLRIFLDFWRFEGFSMLKRLEENPTQEMWQSFLTLALQKRVELLEHARSFIGSSLYRKLLNQLIETEKKLSLLPSDTFVSEEYFWDREEALNYLRGMQIKLAPKTDIPSKKLRREVRELRAISNRLYDTSLPRNITSREQLLLWLVGKKSRLQIDLQAKGAAIKYRKEINAPKKDIEIAESIRKNIENQLKNTHKLIVFINHPFLPFTEEGLTGNKFLDILRSRVDVAYASLFADNQLKQSRESVEKYEQVTREAYKITIRNRIVSKKEYAAQLKKTDIERDLLLKKMELLNLSLSSQLT